MKRPAFFALLALLQYPAATVFSQEQGDCAVQVSVGNYSTNRLLNETFGTFAYLFSLGHTTVNSNYIPAIGVGVRYAARNRWTVGIDGFYETITSRYYEDGTLHVIDLNHYITIGLGTDFYYISRERFRLYSGLAAAYTFGQNNYANTEGERSVGYFHYINAQLNLLGIRFGDRIAGFVELGLGYRGVANAGVSIRF